MASECSLLQQYVNTKDCVTEALTRCYENKFGELPLNVSSSILHMVNQEMNRLYIKELCWARKKVLKELCYMFSRCAAENSEKKPKCRTPKTLQYWPENDSDRRYVIESTIVTPGKTKFSDIAGLSEAKRLLREAVILPLRYPNLFVDGLKPWRRILLFGPPGTGKTKIAKAVSSEVQSTFFCVSSSDVLSSWFGESEKLIKELFKNARANPGRSIIFIDEIDSLCRKRNSNEEEQTRRIKTELLAQMEGIETSNEDNLFILGATNCPWELDTAFLRRFEKRIYVPLPDKEARRELFKNHLGSMMLLSEEEEEKLLKRTEGYSGSDIASSIADALFEPIRELESSLFWKWNKDGKTVSPCQESEFGAVKIRFDSIPAEQIKQRSVTFMDIESVLRKSHCTVSACDLKSYEQFSSCFGHQS